MAIAIRTIGKYDRSKGITWQDIRYGEKLVVHSREWFDKNCRKDSDGDYIMEVTEREGDKTVEFFANSMFDFFGKTVTVEEISKYYILVYEDQNHRWYPEMFEKIAE